MTCSTIFRRPDAHMHPPPFPLTTSGDRTMYRATVSSISLLVFTAISGCAAPPEDLNLQLTRPTVERKFVVVLQPPTKAVPINHIHSWQIKVTSPTGAPVSHAQIAVDGGMPQHGHGLPTRPLITPMSVDGTYLLEGMKFSMTGWWEIKLAIQAREGSDTVMLNFMPSSK